MQARPPIIRRWVLVSSGPEGVQGRPDLYWNAGEQEWSESPDTATEHTAGERDATDLTVFGGDVEWWERQIG